MMRQSFAKAGVGRLCKLFGRTRHAFYEKTWYQRQRYSDEQIVVELLVALKREIPVQSTRSIYLILKPTLRTHGITIGRDSLHEIRDRYNLLNRPRKRYYKTTNSFHRFYKYPNRIRDLVITAIEQVWVCDITYIRVANEFNFLSLITDAYSHLIVGYCLHETLAAEGSLKALKMAISTLKENTSGLIHHSDRGIQYCCDQYSDELKKYSIKSSMTENGDPYENAIAERLNGILKHNFLLEHTFNSRDYALQAVDRAIKNYNYLRPHQSVSMLTPANAHQHEGQLHRCWKGKNYKARDHPGFDSIN
jgi:transposase InsO family protein